MKNKHGGTKDDNIKEVQVPRTGESGNLENLPTSKCQIWILLFWIQVGFEGLLLAFVRWGQCYRGQCGSTTDKSPASYSALHCQHSPWSNLTWLSLHLLGKCKWEHSRNTTSSPSFLSKTENVNCHKLQGRAQNTKMAKYSSSFEMAVHLNLHKWVETLWKLILYLLAPQYTFIDRTSELKGCVI